MIKYLLYPLSWLFTIAVYMRNKLYDWNILRSINSNFPVISVGNIQVGGTGKTPFVIALCKQLISHNIRPLIVTRGYKRSTKHQIILNNVEQYSAQEVGDEPFYMKQILKDIPIIVDHNKKNAVKAANELQNIDCIILDDGFQSRYIKKDIDIVLTSFSQVNNFSLMPFGSFREPVSSLKRAHFIYNTKDEVKKKNNLNVNFTCKRYEGVMLDWKEVKRGDVNNNFPFYSPVIAFCGIANPQYFIQSLKNMNIEIVKKLIFENHCKYDINQYSKLEEAYQVIKDPQTEEGALKDCDLSFITTSKDFVKLDKDFRKKYTIYVLEMSFVINDKKLIDQIKGLTK